jgi:hypothetical protein
MAATMIHEAQHSRLGATHDLVPLYWGNTKTLYLSPWRNDPRPLAGLVHGVYAFHGVADFWSREWPEAGPGAGLQYARTVRQLQAGIEVLDGADDLTPTGTALVSALSSEVSRLPTATLSTETCRLADDLVTYHRVLWQLRHATCDSVDVANLVRQWRLDEPLPMYEPPVRTSEAGSPRGDSPIFRIAAAWLDDPEAVADMARDPAEFGRQYPWAAAADFLLVAGDYAAARARQLADIRAGVMENEVWAALAVAHARLCADPHRSPLVSRPELVRAALPLAARNGRKNFDDFLARYVAGTSTSDSNRR